MATNVGFEYQKAEEEYRDANTFEEKLKSLQKMLKVVPKHKSSENLQASIKERISKLKLIIDNQKKARGAGFSLSVKKEGAAQVCIIGKTNSGKSTLLKKLTGANVEIAEYSFTTKKPEKGIMDYEGIKIQIVEIPAIVKSFNETSLGPTYMAILNQSDLVIMMFDSPEDKAFLDLELKNVKTPKIIYNDQEKKSFSKHLWERLHMIKIHTKQPGKEKDFPPVAFPENSKVEDVTKKVHKDFLKNFKYAKISGKSAKFKWQTVGKDHVLKDDDIVELHMK